MVGQNVLAGAMVLGLGVMLLTVYVWVPYLHQQAKAASARRDHAEAIRCYRASSRACLVGIVVCIWVFACGVLLIRSLP